MRVIKALVLLTLPLFVLLLAFSAHSQTQQSPPPSAATSPAQDKPKEASEEGVPVTNQLVISKCAACHKKDDKGRMTRISYERMTPEGWQEVIKRMVRLNGV